LIPFRLSTVHRLLFLLFVITLGAEARAQRTDDLEPRLWWGSLWTGIQIGDFIDDAPTNASWDFDAGLMLRMTLERQLVDRLSVGVALNHTRLPLSYTSAASGCTRCNADASVTSYGGMIRYGGGLGFHQVYEVTMGVTRYGNFERASPKQSLPPSKGNTDFAFGAGAGFGYTLSRDWQVNLIQEVQYGFHERPPEGSGGSRITRGYVTRVGVRIGW
jgi:hypothetical protein